MRGKSGLCADNDTKHEPIKRVYVEMVKQVVESEAVNYEDD